MLAAPLSERQDQKYPGRTPSTESEAVPGSLQRTTVQLPTSEPLQWQDYQSSDLDLSQLEVKNYCWRSYLLLPRPPDRGLQFALPLRSSRLGSVTQQWWERGTIYPVIVAPRYELESLAVVPGDVAAAVDLAEAVISKPVEKVRFTQQHALVKIKVRYLLTAAVLLCIFLVLGLAGFLLEAQTAAVCAVAVGLLEVWCVYWLCVCSSKLRRSYFKMRQRLEVFSQTDIGLKGYNMRIAGPFVLQFLQPQS